MEKHRFHKPVGRCFQSASSFLHLTFCGFLFSVFFCLCAVCVCPWICYSFDYFLVLPCPACSMSTWLLYIWSLLHWNCGLILRLALKQTHWIERVYNRVQLHIFQYNIHFFHHHNASLLFDKGVQFYSITGLQPCFKLHDNLAYSWKTHSPFNFWIYSYPPLKSSFFCFLPGSSAVRKPFLKRLVALAMIAHFGMSLFPDAHIACVVMCSFPRVCFPGSLKWIFHLLPESLNDWKNMSFMKRDLKPPYEIYRSTQWVPQCVK